MRVGSRSGSPPFDWDDRVDLGPRARTASTAVYLSYYPDLAVPGAAETVGAFARSTALEQGVRRLVLLSGRGEAEAQQAEQAVQDSGTDGHGRALRPGSPRTSARSFFLDPVLGGEIALPAGDVPEPFVDAEDIADVAVAALTEDGHAGRPSTS